jgi:hypothetical protein
MKWFLSGIATVIKKAFNGLCFFWKQGFGDLIGNNRIVKALVDVVLICVWCVALLLGGSSMYISILGIAMLMALLSKMIYFVSESIVGDFFQPFLTIALYAASAAIFWWYPSAAFVVGIFLIPCVTKEVSDSYSSYYIDLTPDLEAQ